MTFKLNMQNNSLVESCCCELFSAGYISSFLMDSALFSLACGALFYPLFHFGLSFSQVVTHKFLRISCRAYPLADKAESQNV